MPPLNQNDAPSNILNKSDEINISTEEIEQNLRLKLKPEENNTNKDSDATSILAEELSLINLNSDDENSDKKSEEKPEENQNTILNKTEKTPQANTCKAVDVIDDVKRCEITQYREREEEEESSNEEDSEEGSEEEKASSDENNESGSDDESNSESEINADVNIIASQINKDNEFKIRNIKVEDVNLQNKSVDEENSEQEKTVCDFAQLRINNDDCNSVYNLSDSNSETDDDDEDDDEECLHVVEKGVEQDLEQRSLVGSNQNEPYANYHQFNGGNLYVPDQINDNYVPNNQNFQQNNFTHQAGLWDDPNEIDRILSELELGSQYTDNILIPILPTENDNILNEVLDQNLTELGLATSNLIPQNVSQYEQHHNNYLPVDFHPNNRQCYTTETSYASSAEFSPLSPFSPASSASCSDENMPSTSFQPNLSEDSFQSSSTSSNQFSRHQEIAQNVFEENNIYELMSQFVDKKRVLKLIIWSQVNVEDEEKLIKTLEYILKSRVQLSAENIITIYAIIVRLVKENSGIKLLKNFFQSDTNILQNIAAKKCGMLLQYLFVVMQDLGIDPSTLNSSALNQILKYPELGLDRILKKVLNNINEQKTSQKFIDINIIHSTSGILSILLILKLVTSILMLFCQF